MPHEAIDFDDLAPVEISVKLLGKNYILKEASSAAVRAYQAAMAKAISKMGPGGKLESYDLGALADVDPILVSHCLYETSGDGRATNKTVTVAIIQTWPDRYTDRLAAKIKEISPSLDKKAKAKEATEETEGEAPGGFDPNAPPAGGTESSH